MIQSDPPPVKKENTLTHLLDGMQEAAEADRVSIRDILDAFGDRTFTPFMLLMAVLMITPLSGIPGMPTLSAAIIVTLGVQALLNRPRLWLPAFLLDRSMSGHRLRWAISWLRKPSAYMDRHAYRRLQILVKGPGRYLTLLVCTLLPLTWPLLEFVPLVTTLGASVVSLFVFGLFTRDGLYPLLGFCVIGLVALIGRSLFG